MGVTVAELRGARVELQGVRRSFDARSTVVDNFSLTIEPGEFVSLLGPSGCGKSTLLRLISSLDAPNSGEVRIAWPDREASQAFVFQEASLLPWRTVQRNVMLPLELMRKKSGASDLAEQAIARVGLSEAKHKYPNQLSGGMKMRASVARALVVHPSLLLLDEPFGALDENTRFRLQEDLHAVWENSGMTTVFVTHSISEAVFLSERVIVLGARPARIILDRRSPLPRSRTSKLRTSQEFVQEVERITAAFQSGEL